MVVSPTDRAVTIPVRETVAVCSSLLTQVRFLTVASSGAMMGWSVTVLPIMSVCVGSSNRMPVTRTRFGWTVTMQLAR